MRAVDPARHLKAVGNTRVLFLMAAPAEYGPALQKLIDPLMIGVGPVEAGVNTGVALATLHHLRALPDLLVSLGSAGSRALEHAGVYQATSVSYRDMDASPLGFPKGVTPLEDIPAVIPLSLRISDVAEATLSTGGAVISGAGYDCIDADMVDMETFAVVRAASRFGVPVLALRGISDGKTELGGLSDWTDYLHVVDMKLASAVEILFDDIIAGRIALAPAQNSPSHPNGLPE